MSFANHEVLPAIAGFFRPLVGRDPYLKESVDDHMKKAYETVGVLEQHLLVNTFLVGERITLADIFAISIVARGFQFLFDKKWREENPNVTRWYETVYNQPMYAAVAEKFVFIDEALKNQPPKEEHASKGKAKEPKAQEPKAKEPRAKEPKVASKPKAKEAEDDEEEEDKPEPKPKHPLQALPKPTLVLDDWKRKYSNTETRGVALPWFWENYKSDEYSIWRVDYKYNDELTITFMTSNLISKFVLEMTIRFD